MLNPEALKEIAAEYGVSIRPDGVPCFGESGRPLYLLIYMVNPHTAEYAFPESEEFSADRIGKAIAFIARVLGAPLEDLEPLEEAEEEIT